MEQSPQERIDQLEQLVASLRHDMRGIVTPAALVAEGLRTNADPAIQRSASRITDVIERIVSRLNATHQVVPPRGTPAPVMGTHDLKKAVSA